MCDCSERAGVLDNAAAELHEDDRAGADEVPLGRPHLRLSRADLQGDQPLSQCKLAL